MFATLYDVKLHNFPKNQIKYPNLTYEHYMNIMNMSKLLDA